MQQAKSVLDTILIEDDEHFQAHYLKALVLEGQLATVVGEGEERKELLGAIEDHAEMAIGVRFDWLGFRGGDYWLAVAARQSRAGG